MSSRRSAHEGSAPLVLRATLAPLRRWWIAVVVFLIVAAGALWQYAGPGAAARRVYVTQQTLYVVVTPTGSPTTYDEYLATQQEDAIARAVASGSVLANPTLDAIIAVRAPHALPLFTPHFGAAPSAVLSAQDVAGALSATNSGNTAVITARASSAAGAAALIYATAGALAQADPKTLLAGVMLPATGLTHATVSFEAAGVASSPTLDASVAAAARQELISRLALGLLVGLLLAYGVDWLVRRGQKARTQAGTAGMDEEAAGMAEQSPEDSYASRGAAQGKNS